MLMMLPLACSGARGKDADDASGCLLGAARGNDASDCVLCFGAAHGNDAHEVSDWLLCLVPPSAMMLVMLPIVCVASMPDDVSGCLLLGGLPRQ